MQVNSEGNREQRAIIEELQSLEASKLAGLKAAERMSEFPADLDERILNGAMQRISKATEKAPVTISIREGMRRQKATRTGIFLRIAAAIAAFGFFLHLSYRLSDGFFKDPCQNEERLACLISQTSSDEIFAFLEDAGLPDEEFLINEELTAPQSADMYEIEMK